MAPALQPRQDQHAEKSRRAIPTAPVQMLSKFVPTQFSTSAQTTAGSLDELMPLISNEAQAAMLAIFYAVEEHIAAHGISWQTKVISVIVPSFGGFF